MAEYIDREALVVHLQSQLKKMEQHGLGETRTAVLVGRFVKQLKDVPTSDVVKVRHVAWNDNIIGFGVKDIASSVQTLFVHVKTINVHTFIAASNSSRQIEVFKAMSMDRNSDDPIQHCMNAILTSAVAQHRKEVA